MSPSFTQTLCEPLGADFEITLSGDTTVVNFTVSGSGQVEVYVDWDTTSNNGYTLDNLSEGTYIAKLLMLVTGGIQIWYNVSGTEPSCINWNQIAPNANRGKNIYGNAGFLSPMAKFKQIDQKIKYFREHQQKSKKVKDAEKEDVCSFPRDEFDASMGWLALTCNEGNKEFFLNFYLCSNLSIH